MPDDGNIAFTTEHMQNVRSVLRRYLNVFVGPGRMFSVDEIALGIPTSPDTVRRWLRGESCPEWPNMCALIAIIGPEFGNAILQPAGVTGLRRIDGACTHAETLREIAEAAAVLAAALADGRIDHTERPRVRKELAEAGVAISQWLAKEGNV